MMKLHRGGHLGDHAAHWSSYIGEVIRDVPLYYPSWLKVSKERKAALIIDIGEQVEPEQQESTNQEAQEQVEPEQQESTNQEAQKQGEHVIKGVALEYKTTWMLVVNIDLSRNKLVGEIPHELTTLNVLMGLNLSHNHLSG
nr:leucine-rich repeat protein [Tanacetum cinerariifolium]